MTRFRTLAVTASALALAACATGPDYVASPTPVAASGPFLSTVPAVTTPAPVEGNWWQLYRDPVLEPGGLAIFISQSGETADTLAALRQRFELGDGRLGIGLGVQAGQQQLLIGLA